jgi:hypothetical protein
MSTPKWHPSWCDPRFCTAYDTEADGTPCERAYHRSSPHLIEEENDPEVTNYVHRSCEANGDGDYIEITKLIAPFAGPWWYPDTHFGEVSFSLQDAGHLNAALTNLLAAPHETHVPDAPLSEAA